MSYRYDRQEPKHPLDSFKKYGRWSEKIIDWSFKQAVKAWERDERLSNPFGVTHQGQWGRRFLNGVWNVISAPIRFPIAVARTAVAATVGVVAGVGLGLGICAWEGLAKGGYRLGTGVLKTIGGAVKGVFTGNGDLFIEGLGDIGEGLLRFTGGTVGIVALGAGAANYGLGFIAATTMVGSSMGAANNVEEHMKHSYLPGDKPDTPPSKPLAKDAPSIRERPEITAEKNPGIRNRSAVTAAAVPAPAVARTSERERGRERERERQPSPQQTRMAVPAAPALPAAPKHEPMQHRPAVSPAPVVPKRPSKPILAATRAALEQQQLARQQVVAAPQVSQQVSRKQQPVSSAEDRIFAAAAARRAQNQVQADGVKPTPVKSAAVTTGSAKATPALAATASKTPEVPALAGQLAAMERQSLSLSASAQDGSPQKTMALSKKPPRIITITLPASKTDADSIKKEVEKVLEKDASKEEPRYGSVVTVNIKSKEGVAIAEANIERNDDGELQISVKLEPPALKLPPSEITPRTRGPSYKG